MEPSCKCGLQGLACVVLQNSRTSSAPQQHALRGCEALRLASPAARWRWAPGWHGSSGTRYPEGTRPAPRSRRAERQGGGSAAGTGPGCRAEPSGRAKGGSWCPIRIACPPWRRGGFCKPESPFFPTSGLRFLAKCCNLEIAIRNYGLNSPVCLVLTCPEAFCSSAACSSAEGQLWLLLLFKMLILRNS